MYYMMQVSENKIIRISKYNRQRNIAKGTTDPRVEFISQVAHKS